MKHKRNIVIRSVAIMLAIAFLWQDVVWAYSDIPKNTLATKTLMTSDGKSTAHQKYFTKYLNLLLTRKEQKKEPAHLGIVEGALELTRSSAKEYGLKEESPLITGSWQDGAIKIAFSNGKKILFYNPNISPEDIPNSVSAVKTDPAKNVCADIDYGKYLRGQFFEENEDMNRLSGTETVFDTRATSPITPEAETSFPANGARLVDPFNFSYGEGVGLRHMRVNNMIPIHDMAMIKKGEHYLQKFYEKTVPEEEDESYLNKIESAMAFLKLRGGEYAERVQSFYENTTVILVDMPTHNLMSGESPDGKPFYQLTHLGRGRWVIFISRKTMDDFDISNIEDMKELATILNHDQTELDLMHEPKNAEKAQTLQGYEDLLEELHKKAKKDDPFRITHILEERINRWAKRDRFILQFLKTEIAEKTRELEAREARLTSAKDLPGRINFTYDTAKLAMQIGYAHETLENQENAQYFYKRASLWFDEIPTIDTAILPNLALRNTIRLLILEGDYESAYEEFQKLVEGRVGTAIVGKKTQDFTIVSDTIANFKEKLYSWLHEVSFILLRHAESTDDVKNTRRALQTIENMTDYIKTYVEKHRNAEKLTEEEYSRKLIAIHGRHKKERIAKKKTTKRPPLGRAAKSSETANMEALLKKLIKLDGTIDYAILQKLSVLEGEELVISDNSLEESMHATIKDKKGHRHFVVDKNGNLIERYIHEGEDFKEVTLRNIKNPDKKIVLKTEQIPQQYTIYVNGEKIGFVNYTYLPEKIETIFWNINNVTISTEFIEYRGHGIGESINNIFAKWAKEAGRKLAVLSVISPVEAHILTKVLRNPVTPEGEPITDELIERLDKKDNGTFVSPFAVIGGEPNPIYIVGDKKGNFLPYRSMRTLDDIEKNVARIVPLFAHALMGWVRHATPPAKTEKKQRPWILFDAPATEAEKIENCLKEHIIKPLTRMSDNNDAIRQILEELDTYSREDIDKVRRRIETGILSAEKGIITTDASRLKEFKVEEFENSIKTAVDVGEDFDWETHYYPYVEIAFFAILRTLSAQCDFKDEKFLKKYKQRLWKWYREIPNIEKVDEGTFMHMCFEADGVTPKSTVILKFIPKAKKFKHDKLLQLYKRIETFIRNA